MFSDSVEKGDGDMSRRKELRAFTEATDKEGGVTDYAKDQLKDHPMAYTENFAEMTAKISHGRDLGLDTSKTIYYENYPKTYAAWYKIVGHYGWKDLPKPREST